MNLPATINAYIHAQPTGNPDEPYHFATWGCDMSTCGYIPIAKAEIPFPQVTAEQIQSRHLVLLKLKREEVYEEARKKAAELDEQIARIESITYNPTPQEPSE